MDLARFHNALRILHSIDGGDFGAAGLSCDPGASINLFGAWQKFRAAPAEFFFRCDDQSAEALWLLIEKRQQPRPSTHGA